MLDSTTCHDCKSTNSHFTPKKCAMYRRCHPFYSGTSCLKVAVSKKHCTICEAMTYIYRVLFSLCLYLKDQCLSRNRWGILEIRFSFILCIYIIIHWNKIEETTRILLHFIEGDYSWTPLLACSNARPLFCGFQLSVVKPKQLQRPIHGQSHKRKQNKANTRILPTGMK